MCHKSRKPPIYGTSLEAGTHEKEQEEVGYGAVRRKKAIVVLLFEEKVPNSIRYSQ